MNRWTSKKPLWPISVALGCLFVLAVAAPSRWHDYRSLTRSTVEDLADREIEISQPPQSPPQSIVSLEPVLDEPTLFVEKPEPALQEFDLDVLLQMRDLLRGFVDRLPNQAQPSEAALRKPLPQVSSENDRLAMLDTSDRPRLDRITSRVPDLAPIPNQITPKAAKKDRFAELLLEAARRFQAGEKSEPRLATRPPATATQQTPTLAPTLAPVPTLALTPTLAPVPTLAAVPTLAPVPTLASVPTLAAVPTRAAIPTQAPVEGKATSPIIRHRPNVLFDELHALSGVPQASLWAEQVASNLRQLTDQSPTPETRTANILDQLHQSVAEGNSQAPNLSNYADQQNWQQAIQSLDRRLGIWQVLLAPASLETSTAVEPSMMPLLAEVAALLATESNGNDWREYLMIDRIAAASSEGASIDAKGRNRLALEILRRIDDQRLTTDQVKFLSTPPMLDLQKLLQPWAAQSIDLNRLAALLERYESGREHGYAVAIARIQQRLSWSGKSDWLALADHLDRHYRSSNMRIALSSKLLNRMIPKQTATVTSVQESIAGAKVRGMSRTTTNLSIRLQPDPNSWHFDLEARGKVYSNTQSQTWPARVRNAARMYFDAKKTIVINHEGLKISPTQATAKGRHDLIGVDSQLDGVPLLGSLVREIARNKNRKARPKAMSQVKSKVAQQVRTQMDREADPKFSNLEEKFRDNVLAPMGQLALIADPMAMYTTQNRAVMQLRLANKGQLGAHTPRPLAPADSFASLQLHETALNNALAGLELEGRRMKIDELFRFLAKKLGYINPAIPENMPTRALIEFATRDALLVHCDDDRLNLILNIRELAHGRDKIKNFKVHVQFQPTLEGLDVRLIRNGSLQFSGRRLKTGPRIVLHSIIGKLFPKDQEVRVLAGDLRNDPRLAGLMVTQLVIDDGWIGLALGPAHPERTAWRSPTIKKSKNSILR